ncbi:MAG: RHS repeat-associated core domain-containing protein [Firmicutes bacterium]|nr:RHS repeat-associated core domain-containing protein [Bacillota bacterium]
MDYVVDKRKQSYKFQYENEELTAVDIAKFGRQNITTDNLGRLEKTEIAGTVNDFSYYHHDSHATGLINTHTQKIGDDKTRKRYVYDGNSNITEIKDGFNRPIVKYEYDELNRLVREGNAEFGYDNNGNILFKKTGDDITAYEYDGNRLISRTLSNGDRERFEYDVLGNPTLYRGNNLSWSNLRNLDKITFSGQEIDFKYNAAGLRVKKEYEKQVDGEDTLFESYYHWANDRLVSETRVTTTNSHEEAIGNDIDPTGTNTHNLIIDTTTNTLDFMYGVDGIVGFKLNGKINYFYAKNIQDDVEKIIDSKGKVVAEYSYDAWGNHTIELDIDGIATLNPIRYRSYYFDTETNLYYLKSRYYDSEIGRFINIDTISILDETKNQINGLNLYAYCGNNPVMNVDPNGTLFSLFIGLLIASAVIIATTTAVGAIQGGVQAHRSGYCWRQGARDGALNGLMTGVSLSMMVVGVALTITGVGGPAGSMLFGAGFSSLMAGSSSYSSGGSFFAGWIGGLVSGALSGSPVPILGPAAGAFFGTLITDRINGNPVDLERAIIRAVVAGVVDIVPGLSMRAIGGGNTAARIFFLIRGFIAGLITSVI